MNLKRHLRAAVRAAVGERGRAFRRRASYALGFRPRVNRAAAHSVHYPDRRRAALVISADLELAWAWRYARVADPLAFARQRAQQGRRNLGVLLDLCDRYDLPVTWATVGHLFLNGCSRSGGRSHREVPRVPYFENEYWVYQVGDWFDADPGSERAGEPDWPNWYGPDMIRSILDRRVRHEVGCHTFSHVVFSDEHCPAEVAAAELHLCQELASRWGLTLRSFVFPGNLAGNYGSLRAAGFAAYRFPMDYDLDVPRRDHLGMWRIPGGICLDRPSRAWTAPWTATEQVKLVRKYVDAAVDCGLVGSLWFHPETHSHDVDETFAEIFEYISARRSDLWVTTMGGLADWLDSPEAWPMPASGPAALG